MPSLSFPGSVSSSPPRRNADVTSLLGDVQVMEFLLRLVEWERLSKARPAKW